MTLPIGAAMTNQDVDYVADHLQEILRSKP